MENSRPMDGKAILIEDPMKGVRKDAAVVTNRVTLLLTSEAFSMLLPSVANHTLHDTCIAFIYLAFMATMITDEGTCDQDIINLRRQKVIYIYVKITRIPLAPRRS